jgi:photosystem II stability/assembly factor-like uncharacterized protein
MLKHLFLFCILLSLVFITYAQWQPTNGPAGQYIRSIHNNAGFVYAATGGGVLVSEDEGQSWEFRNEGLKSGDTKCLESLGDYVFVSTDENVFRSNDEGLSWEAAGFALDGTYTKALTVCYDKLFAGTYLGGLYRSSDTGASWESLSDELPVSYIYYLASDDISIFAGTYQEGMFRSTDQGDTWTAINNGLSEPNIMAVYCYQGKVYASTLSSGAFMSNDNGNTWTNITSPNLPSIKAFTSDDAYLYAASFGNGMYRSDDGGNTWNNVSNGISGASIWAAETSNNAVFVGVSSGYIYKSVNYGDSWFLCNGSISFDACAGSLYSSDEVLITGTHGSGLHTTTNEGASWMRAASIGTVEIRSVFAVENLVFAGTDMLGIYRSNDNGYNYFKMNNGLGSSWIQTFCQYMVSVYAGSRDAGIFRTNNYGSDWYSVNTGLGSNDIRCLCANDSYIFAGTFDSGVYWSGGFEDQWNEMNGGLGDLNITCLETAGDLLIAGTNSDGVYTNFTLNYDWTPSSNGLPANSNIRCLHVYNNTIFCGTGEGEIYRSIDFCDSWEEVSDGLIGAPVLALYSFDGYLYAGINAGGVWKRPLDQITGLEEINDDNLIKIYPNPAQDYLYIESKSELEDLTIYNMQGQAIIRQYPSVSSVKINLQGLPKGVYILEARTKDKIISNKFILR